MDTPSASFKPSARSDSRPSPSRHRGWSEIHAQTGVAAYPTIRELLLAKLMGTQGVVSSICPQHGADNAAGDDPLYGYRPAMTAIIDRVKAGIGP